MAIPYILIKEKRTLHNGEVVEMTEKEKLQLNRYLNKYFRKFWQEVRLGEEVSDGNIRN